MALGAVAIALSSATEREHASSQEAAERERQRYNVEGRAYANTPTRRTLVDWLLIVGTTAVFAILAVMARLPHIRISFTWTAALGAAMLTLLATCGIILWRTTDFR